jgi:hypothetical protein
MTDNLHANQQPTYQAVGFVDLDDILLPISYSVSLVRQRTIPTERPPLVGEVSANFSG